MAKLLLYSDPHYCSYLSVLRQRGEKYSLRIENLQKAFNWINQIAKEKQIDKIICLGDFFDKTDLTAEEITSLTNLNLKHHEFLIGNHEALSYDLKINATNVFSESEIYDSPTLKMIDNTQILFLPYVIEQNRKPLKEILQEVNINYNQPLIILSHNDIKDVQYGQFKSMIGYEIKEIEENCDMFINGHIHNGGWITSNILNLGSLDGLNFNNDAENWKPSIAIIDTKDLKVELVENPFSFLFYKKEFITINEVNDFYKQLNNHKNIVSFKINENMIKEVNQSLELNKNIFYKRLTINYNNEIKEVDINITPINCFDKLKEFIKEKYIGNEYNYNLMLQEIDNLRG